MADGGEGTVPALMNSLGGRAVNHEVTGPLGNRISASYGMVDDKIALIEMAAAAGLDLLSPDKRNPMKTTTYGVGELIIHALGCGVRHFIIGLGGSATNDGGIGMLQALGFDITGLDHQQVPFGGEGLLQIEHISTDRIDPRLKGCVFEVACDVTNPLTGEYGATNVYGPQKGADVQMLKRLDEAMYKYGKIIEQEFKKPVLHLEGAGAAGGLGAAFSAFLGAELKKGIEIVMDISKLADEIKAADLVITGEGKIDQQTLNGKTPIGIARIAKTYSVPVIVIGGSVQITQEVLANEGVTALFSIADGPMTLNEALAKGEELIEQLTRNLFLLMDVRNK